MKEPVTTPPFDVGRERGEDRRQEEQAVNDERRQSDDRRTLRYGIKLKTARSLGELEDWLDEHCSGLAQLVLLDMDDDLNHKDVQIMFEHKSDKEKFVSHYA